MNMPNNWHVVTIGQRPAKDAENHYLPVPEANVAVIRNTLSQLAPNQYQGLYHGNATFGVDAVVEEFARTTGIRQFQFPAYWRDWDFDKRQFVDDKYAGAKASRQMLRAAKDAIYDKNTPNNVKPDHGAILLTFGPEDAAEIKAAVDYLGRLKNNPVQVRNVPLPVDMQNLVTAPAATGTPFGS